MARVPVYNRSEQVRAQSGARQQAFDNGAGEIAQGVTALGAGMGQLAQGMEVRNQKIDEAYTSQFDADFSQKIREVERGFLSAKAGNAVGTAGDASKRWNEVYNETLDQAQNPRQRAMLANALNQRRQRWQGQFDGHLMRETDVWHDNTEKARIGQLSVDVSNLAIGSAERDEAEVQLGEVVGNRIRRMGLSTDAAIGEMQTVMTGIHEATVNSLLAEGRVPEAVAYFEERGGEMMPDRRAALMARVENENLEFTAFTKVNGWDVEQGGDEEFEVEVESDDGQVTRQTETFMNPLRGQPRMSSGYGQREAPLPGASTNHMAVDWAVPVGTSVRAPLSGVARIKNQPNGAGLYVELDHGGGLVTRYFHLSSTDGIRDGQRVSQGDVFALSGNSGNSTGPHLHFEVLRNGRKVDPASLNNASVETSVGGGGRPSRRSSGMPNLRTAEEAREWARNESQGDWRLAKRMGELAEARVSDHYSSRDRLEQEAWRGVQDYLPDGSSPVTDVAQIPKERWDALSPVQQNSIRGALRQKRNSDEGIDRIGAARLEQQYRDMAAGTQVDRDRFLNTNFWEMSGQLTVSQMEQMTTLQRTLRGDTGLKNADQILDGQSDLVNAYALAAKINTGAKATPDDLRRRGLFTRYLQERMLAVQALQDTPLTDLQKRASMAQAARLVEVDMRDAGDRGPDWQEMRAYEIGELRRSGRNPAVRSVIPKKVREEIEDGLRAGNVRVTDSAVEDVWLRGLGEGRWSVQ